MLRLPKYVSFLRSGPGERLLVNLVLIDARTKNCETHPKHCAGNIIIDTLFSVFFFFFFCFVLLLLFFVLFCFVCLFFCCCCFFFFFFKVPLFTAAMIVFFFFLFFKTENSLLLFNNGHMFVFSPLITGFISGLCGKPTIFHENAIFLTLIDNIKKYPFSSFFVCFLFKHRYQHDQQAPPWDRHGWSLNIESSVCSLLNYFWLIFGHAFV